MITGNILILGAVGIIALFVVFGFLLGMLRGFRKSLFFTIVFIVVVILSFITATVFAKNLYSGSTLWTFFKRVIPSDMKEGSEGVNSLKEFVRFYIVHNYTEMLDSGITAGESIVANQNAMGVIDGLLIMILKIFTLIVSYIVFNIAFYIVFGLIYVLFLRQKPYIETTTTTDEEGNETVEEREVKPNKKRLAGGLIGAGKGFLKSMIILIPLTFIIGIVAQIEIPKNSSVSNDVKLASGSSDNTFNDVVNACKKYDNSIGKIYLGLDDFVMDSIISYEVKGADGKKVKVVVRKELNGAIDVYNTIEKEIGVDNLKNYDFKANMNSKEMRTIVESISTNLSNSNAFTTTLTVVGDEVMVILADKASKNDKDMELFFSEFDLTGKNVEWWRTELAQLSSIYNSFADMNLDFTKADTKEYNLMFAETKAEDYEKFVDEVFNSELIEMAVNGGLKYAVKKLPEDYGDISDTTNQVIKDDAVNEEFKAFSKLIDLIRDDIKFNDGSVDTQQLSVRTLKSMVDTEILLRSKIVSKIIESVLKNTLCDIQFNDTSIGFDKKVFDNASFNIHNELKSLVKILEDGYGLDFTIGQLKDISNVSQISQVCNMLKSDGMKESVLGKELFSKTLETLVTTIEPDENYDNVVWTDEIAPMADLLSSNYAGTDLLSNLTNLQFTTIKVETLDAIEKNIKTSKLLQNKMAKSLAEPMSTKSMLADNGTSAWDGAKWNFEMPKINKVLKTLAKDGEIKIAEVNMDETSSIKRATIEQIETNIADSEALENMFAKAIKDSLYDEESIDDFPSYEVISGVDMHSTWWEIEIKGLCNVIYAFCGDKEEVVLGDFADTTEMQVKVIKSLYAESGKTKDNGQKTNIGVSEFIQYQFKPELRDLSKRSDTEYFVFTKDYNWDKEIKTILDLFIYTQGTYNEVTNDLDEKGPEDTIKISEVYFGLYNDHGEVSMSKKEAACRNKKRIAKINESIDGITYLQYTLAKDISKMMSSDDDFKVTDKLPEKWDNDDWVREMDAFNSVMGYLITDDNPDMDLSLITLNSLTDDPTVKDKIKENAIKSYLLQSKLADIINKAGVSTKAKIKYAVQATWDSETNTNTEFGLLWDNPATYNPF